MIFLNEHHAEQWAEAIDRSGAHRDDDTVNGDFGASLFIITGIPFFYERFKHHVHSGRIDFEAILRNGLSTGEVILVSLAGNLYNGGFFDRYTPKDIVSYCDEDMTELAVKAIWLRGQRIDVSTIFD